MENEVRRERESRWKESETQAVPSRVVAALLRREMVRNSLAQLSTDLAAVCTDRNGGVGGQPKPDSNCICGPPSINARMAHALHHWLVSACRLSRYELHAGGIPQPGASVGLKPHCPLLLW